jgi:hypothetical protein
MTEITHVEEGKFFVDDQRVGTYAIGITNITSKPFPAEWK